MLTTKRLVTFVLVVALVAITLAALTGCKKDYRVTDTLIIVDDVEGEGKTVDRVREVSREEAKDWCEENDYAPYFDNSQDPSSSEHRYYIVTVTKPSSGTTLDIPYIITRDDRGGIRD